MRPTLVTLTILFLQGLPAHAHDGNFARWDVRSQGQELVLRLRTAGAALHQNLRATHPTAGWDDLAPEDYAQRLERHLARTVVVREDGRRLRLAEATARDGHEATVVLSFPRATGDALGALSVDLTRFSERPNQHHLVFVHQGTERHRFMLHRESGMVLNLESER